MVTHNEVLVIYQTAMPSLHSDFTVSSWLLYSFVLPPVFVMYLSSHPDAPTTTPIPTTATTTTTTITTIISYPDANQGTVSPSHILFICVYVCGLPYSQLWISPFISIFMIFWQPYLHAFFFTYGLRSSSFCYLSVFKLWQFDRFKMLTVVQQVKMNGNNYLNTKFSNDSSGFK